MNLSQLKPGESARIISVGGSGSLRQHFLDMGLIPDAVCTLTKLAPMGDPMEFMVHGYELSIRKDDAKEIERSVPSSVIPRSIQVWERKESIMKRRERLLFRKQRP